MKRIHLAGTVAALVCCGSIFAGKPPTGPANNANVNTGTNAASAKPTSPGSTMPTPPIPSSVNPPGWDVVRDHNPNVGPGDSFPPAHPKHVSPHK